MVQVNTPINLRVMFKKTGDLQYISHLDLVRTMHKIIVRARLPLKYTEGFNPKPKMVFAAPLSIGTESLCEFVDIRLSEYMDTELAKRVLNDNMAENIRVIDAYYPESKLTNLAWLAYTVKIKTNNADSALAAECERFLLSDSVEVEKKSKKGDMVNVNIRPLIRSASATFDGEYLILNCTLSASPSAFLNPELVVKALKGRYSILSDKNLLSEWYSILRTEAYKEDMSLFR